MTHAHNDHYYNFLTFMASYAQKVTVERMIYTFPNADDTEQFSALSRSDSRHYFPSGTAAISAFEAAVETYSIPTLCGHTGQTFRFGDVVFECLSSQDDYVRIPETLNFNALSLVYRMTAAGQTVLWTADCSFPKTQFVQRYGDELKSDILQVPHHGFVGGTPKGYDCIRPQVCLLPVSRYDGFYSYCAFLEGSNYLFDKVPVAELIDGDEQRTLTLPYTPKSYGEAELRRRFEEGQASAGKKCWFYSDLQTDSETDCGFTLTNTTVAAATVKIDLFFEASAQVVRFIHVTVPKYSVLHINLKTGENLDPNPMVYNPDALEQKGFPENARFSARFLCDRPIYVSHPTRSPL